MEGLNLVPFQIVFGIHAFIKVDGYKYTLVVHEDVQKFLNVRKLEDIFIVNEFINPVPEVDIEVMRFVGKETMPLYHFINLSCICGNKVVMIPKNAYAQIKMRF